MEFVAGFVVAALILGGTIKKRPRRRTDMFPQASSGPDDTPPNFFASVE